MVIMMTLTVNCQAKLKVDEFGEFSLAGTLSDSNSRMGGGGSAVKRGCLYAYMMQIKEGPLYRAVASVISE
jgi:hypothetical protein